MAFTFNQVPLSICLKDNVSQWIKEYGMLKKFNHTMKCNTAPSNLNKLKSNNYIKHDLIHKTANLFSFHITKHFLFKELIT